MINSHSSFGLKSIATPANPVISPNPTRARQPNTDANAFRTGNSYPRKHYGIECKADPITSFAYYQVFPHSVRRRTPSTVYLSHLLYLLRSPCTMPDPQPLLATSTVRIEHHRYGPEVAISDFHMNERDVCLGATRRSASVRVLLGR